MNRTKDKVDRASDDSFPASDPPSFTPVTGSGDPHASRQVVDVGGQIVVHVENGRGEELREHLASHGISAKVSPPAQGDFERVEIADDDAEMEDVQAILDQWED